MSMSVRFGERGLGFCSEEGKIQSANAGWRRNGMSKSIFLGVFGHSKGMDLVRMCVFSV